MYLYVLQESACEDGAQQPVLLFTDSPEAAMMLQPQHLHTGSEEGGAVAQGLRDWESTVDFDTCGHGVVKMVHKVYTFYSVFDAESFY